MSIKAKNSVGQMTSIERLLMMYNYVKSEQIFDVNASLKTEDI